MYQKIIVQCIWLLMCSYIGEPKARGIPTEVPHNADLTSAMYPLLPIYYNITLEIHY